MLSLLKVSLLTAGIISNVCGSSSTPLATENEPISQPGQKEAVWSTRSYIEEMLIKNGDLKPGQHLPLHEIWEIVDFLKARVHAREKTVR